LPNRLHDLFHRGLKEKESFFGHGPAVHLDREFPALAVDHFDFHSRFLPQGIRHTGGVLARAVSDRALANGDLFHGSWSFDWDLASSGGIGPTDA
jgi:hypothetical protein